MENDERKQLKNEMDGIVDAMIGDRVETMDETIEQCAMLHEQINPASDAERLEGVPGCGAMGAIIEYRDAIRQLARKEADV